MEKQTPASEFLRQHAEQLYAGELEALKRQDTHPRPEHWELSPRAVCTYLLGGTLEDGFAISPKYIGSLPDTIPSTGGICGNGCLSETGI